MVRLYRKKTPYPQASPRSNNPESSSGKASYGTVQLHEVQDVLDSQARKFSAYKEEFFQQNTELARANATLKMKIANMECSLNEVIQENVLLRSNLSNVEIRYKEKFAKQLNILEEGVTQRFQELFHIIESFREKTSIDKGENTLNENLVNNHRTSRRRRHSQLYLDDNEQASSIEINNSDCNDEQERQRKRRKSMRRQTIFVNNNNRDEEEKEDENEELNNSESNNIPNGSTPFEEDNENIIRNYSFGTSEIVTSTIPEEIDNTNDQQSSTSSSKEPTKKTTKSKVQKSVEPNTSSSKTDVYNDDSHKLSNNEQNNNNPVKNKIKHSIKPSRRTSSKLKRVVDEVMPTSKVDNDISTNFSRSRRTRGKNINYKLPSLRVKMRRPTKDMVDATTLVDIHDLEVKNKKDTTVKKEKNTKSIIIPKPKVVIIEPTTDTSIESIQNSEFTFVNSRQSSTSPAVSTSNDTEHTVIDNTDSGQFFIEESYSNNESTEDKVDNNKKEVTKSQSTPEVKSTVSTSKKGGDTKKIKEKPLKEKVVDKSNKNKQTQIPIQKENVLKDITNVKKKVENSDTKKKIKLGKRLVDGDLNGDGAGNIFNKNADYLQCLDLLGSQKPKRRTYKTQLSKLK